MVAQIVYTVSPGDIAAGVVVALVLLVAVIYSIGVAIDRHWQRVKRWFR
ncbi:hypothetical protein U8335_04105 [Roseiconus lacunae]|uniref:Uncharacterized protein n=1 Tax=Roseiconus lacunae TaxID=2605694 RepID=A0ABT7PHH1_9BACT|nr:hypothetical protein [Roseiconus lacunae]MDM4015945.1 hypothetical protein [Roseiconus lacunae]WRQ51726.1 hypothetical protein U8335_04105 [Stieleria sp. HD01]